MNLFKTNYRRVRENIMQTVGAHQISEDGEFEAKVQAFQQLVRDMERVHEAALLWSDCVDALAMAGAGLGDTMSKFFAANSTPARRSDLDTSSKAYLSVQADINETLRVSVRKSLLERCLRPTTEVLAMAPAVNEKVALRKQLKLDSEFYSSKFKSKISAGKDESDPEVAKVAAKMRDAEKALSAMHDDLVATFDALEEARCSLLIPEMSAMVGCQFFFMQSSAQMMSEVMSFFPQAASTMCALHAERDVAPFVSTKVIENLRSATGAARGSGPVAVTVTDPSSAGPAAHISSSHSSLSTARQAGGLRPQSEIVSMGVKSADPGGEKPRSVPLGSESPVPGKPPPPISAPRMPPPKPIKKAPPSTPPVPPAPTPPPASPKATAPVPTGPPAEDEPAPPIATGSPSRSSAAPVPSGSPPRALPSAAPPTPPLTAPPRSAPPPVPPPQAPPARPPSVPPSAHASNGGKGDSTS